MSIYTTFVPTYLYIKRHTVTGLLYFGKTTKSESFLLNEYTGSGNYWLSHIKTHGRDQVETVWYCLFTEQDELVKFALMCSNQWDIVNAKTSSGKKIWANEKPENGLAGNPPGVKFSESHRKSLSKSQLGKLQSADTVKKKSESLKGKPWSNERKIAQSLRQGVPYKKSGKLRTVHHLKGVSNVKLKNLITVVDINGQTSKLDKDSYYDQFNYYTKDNLPFVTNSSAEGKRRLSKK